MFVQIPHVTLVALAITCPLVFAPVVRVIVMFVQIVHIVQLVIQVLTYMRDNAIHLVLLKFQ